MNKIIKKENSELIENNILDKNIILVINDFLNTFSSDTTKNRYRTVLKWFFIENSINTLKDLSNIHISDLRKEIDIFWKHKTDINKNTKEILNPATLNNIMYIMRSFFNYLVNFYNYTKNPLAWYKKLKTKENSNTYSLNRLELISILNYSKEKYNNTKNPIRKVGQLRNYLILSFLSLSLRRSEACNLEWSNLDLEKEYITVLQKWGWYKITPTPRWLLDYLLIYKKEIENLNIKNNYIFSPFNNNTNWNINKPISPDYIVQIIKKICIDLHINKKITPHSFRKTFIELSLDKNENYNNIMNSTGHKTIQLIRYYDNRDKIKNNSINTVSDWF